MVDAIRMKSDSAEEAHRRQLRRRARRARQLRAPFRDKTFDTLTAEEKDDLLKTLAVTMGLIEDDEEEQEP
jgi:hypothetical protein